MNANGGWCAPTEVLYGPDVPPLWDENGDLNALCLPCVGGVEHVRGQQCTRTHMMKSVYPKPVGGDTVLLYSED